MDKLKRIIIFCLLFLLLISFHQNSILDADHHNPHPSQSSSSSSPSSPSSSSHSISSVSAVSTLPKRSGEESETKSNNLETRSRTGEKVRGTNSMKKVLRTRFLKGENFDSIPSFSRLPSSSIITGGEEETQEKRGIKQEEKVEKQEEEVGKQGEEVGKQEGMEGKMFERVENVVFSSLKSISKSNESFLLKNVSVTEKVPKKEPLKASRTEPELVSKTTSTLHEQEKKTNSSLGIRIMERKYSLPQDPFIYSSIPSSSSSILASSSSNNSSSLLSSSNSDSSSPLEVISEESGKGRIDLNRNHVLEPIRNRLFNHEKIFLSNQYFENQELERDEEEEKKKKGDIFGLIDTGRKKNVVEKNVIGKKTLNPSITSFPLHVIFDPITFNGIKDGARENMEERERRREEKVEGNMEEKIEENIEGRNEGEKIKNKDKKEFEEKKKEEKKGEENISVTSASMGKNKTTGVNGVRKRKIPSSSSFSSSSPSSSFVSRTESSILKDGREKITIKEKEADNSFEGEEKKEIFDEEEKKEKNSSIASAPSIPVLSSSSLSSSSPSSSLSSSSFLPSTSSPSGNHVRNNQQMLIQNDAFTRMEDKVHEQESKELVLEQEREVLELEHEREKGRNGNEYNSNKKKEEGRLNQQEKRRKENDEQTNQKKEEKKGKEEKEGDERRRHTNDGEKMKNQEKNTANMEMDREKIIQAAGERNGEREGERKLEEEGRNLRRKETKLKEKEGRILQGEKNEQPRYRNGNESSLSPSSSFSSPSSSSFLLKPSSPSLSPSTVSIFPVSSSSSPSLPGSKDEGDDDKKKEKDEEKDGANRTKVSMGGANRTKDQDDEKKKSMNNSMVIYERDRMKMTGDEDQKDGKTVDEKEKERVEERVEERRKKVEYSEILSVDHMLQYLTFSTCLLLLFMTLFTQFQSELPLQHPRISVEESRKKGEKKGKKGKNHGTNEHCNWIPLSIKSLISRTESEHVPRTESIGLNERQFISINFLLSFILIQFLFLLNGFPSLQSFSSPSSSFSSSPFSSSSITSNGQHLDHVTRILMSIQNVLMSNQKDKVLMSNSTISSRSNIDDIHFGSEQISQPKEMQEQSSEGESSVRKGSDTERSDEEKVITDGCHSMVYLIHFLHLSCCFWLLSHSIHLYQITVLASVSNVSKSSKKSQNSRTPYHHCRTQYRNFTDIIHWIKHFSSLFSPSRIVSNVSKNNDLSHAKKFDTNCVKV